MDFIYTGVGVRMQDLVLARPVHPCNTRGVVSFSGPGVILFFLPFQTPREVS